MKARATRNRRGRRYLGPTCLAGSGPANLAMVDRSMRKGRRAIARKDRRTPRPLYVRLWTAHPHLGHLQVVQPVYYVQVRLTVDDTEFRRELERFHAIAGCAPADS